MLIAFLAARLVEAENGLAKAKSMYKASKDDQFKLLADYWFAACGALKHAISRVPHGHSHPKFIPES